MAIWQVPFTLYRRDGKFEFTDEVFVQSLKELEKVLPQKTPWCKDYKQYGDRESTFLEFDFSEVMMNRLWLYIDLRCITKQELQAICEFSQKNNLIMEHGIVSYEVIFENFCESFECSQAYRNLKDPKGFLEQLKDGRVIKAE